ncbi:MAG: lmo0937 family membrane protein [Chloroflexota bacterium]|nr:lmo0937 family membrane protein [Chloroflexota bacterium]
MGSLVNILWTIAVILIVLWLLGFVLNIAGGLIHILLVIAIIVIAYNLITGRRAV